MGTSIIGRGCFSCDCLLHSLTQDGMIPISTLRVGDTVYGYDHYAGEVRRSKVLAVSLRRVTRGFVRIGGSIVCTDDHEFCTHADGAYTRAGEIETNMSFVRWKEGPHVENVPAVLLPGSEEEVEWEDLPALRREESGCGIRVQKVPYRVFAKSAGYRAYLRQLREGLPAQAERTRSRRSQVWRATRVFLSRVLHGVSEATDAAQRKLYALWRAVARLRETEVLFTHLLPGASQADGQAPGRLSRGFNGFEESAAVTEGPSLRSVRPADVSGRGPPHRPRPGKQHSGEPRSSVSSLSQAVSHVQGVCAGELAPCLRKETARL